MGGVTILDRPKASIEFEFIFQTIRGGGGKALLFLSHKRCHANDFQLICFYICNELNWNVNGFLKA